MERKIMVEQRRVSSPDINLMMEMVHSARADGGGLTPAGVNVKVERPLLEQIRAVS